MNIGAATAEDARAIAQVQVLSWQSAYRGLLPAQFLDLLSVEQRELMWRQQLEQRACDVLVARTEGQICGFVSFGASRDEDAAPETAELMAIYLAPHCWSTGFGRSLWLAARQQMLQQGFSAATLWVLADNARALRFYSLAGFMVQPASRKTFTLGGVAVDEVRCARLLRRAGQEH